MQSERPAVAVGEVAEETQSVAQLLNRVSNLFHAVVDRRALPLRGLPEVGGGIGEIPGEVAGEGEADGEGGLGEILWGVDSARVGGEGSDAETWVAGLEAGGVDQILGRRRAVVGCGGEGEREEEEEEERKGSHGGGRKVGAWEQWGMGRISRTMVMETLMNSLLPIII